MAIIVTTGVIISILIVNNIQGESTNTYEILQKQRFVFVQDAYDLKEGSYSGIGFDLKEKNLFVNASTVLKDNKLYGRSGKFNKKEFYEHALNGEITSILKYPPELEKKYLNKELQFSKVRITYNKEFLPTKIEWYYKGPEGLKWYTWRTYSYPFKNKADFNKKLDEQIQLIKDIEEEHEAEAADG